MNVSSSPWLFLKMGLQHKASYKFNFGLDLVSVFSQTLLFFFIARLITPGKVPELAAYHDDFFAFVLMGIAFSSYFSVFLSGLAGAIREEQKLGTIEALVISPQPFFWLMVWDTILPFLEATLRILLYLAAGFLFFSLALPTFSVLSALSVLFMSLMAFLPLGILGAAFILVFKEGNPLSPLAGLFKFLSGVYFPLSLFPQWLQGVVYLQPLAPALMALRKLVLGGASLAEVVLELKCLVIFTVIFFPISLFAFQWALRKAKLSGALSHY